MAPSATWRRLSRRRLRASKFLVDGSGVKRSFPLVSSASVAFGSCKICDPERIAKLDKDLRFDLGIALANPRTDGDSLDITRGAQAGLYQYLCDA